MNEAAAGSGARVTAVLGTKETALRLALDLARLGRETRAVEALVIRVLSARALDEALAGIRGYTDLILTSRPAARILSERCRALGLGPESLGHLRVHAVGPATAAALGTVEGLPAPIVPARADAESLAEAIGDPAGRRFLHPRAENARDTLDRRLGASLDARAVYRSHPGDLGPLFEEIERGSVGAVVLCAPSVARHFLDSRASRPAGSPVGLPLVALGEPTARAIRNNGGSCHVAKTPDALGIDEALARPS